MHEQLQQMMSEAKPYNGEDDGANSSPIIPLSPGTENAAPYPVHALPDVIRAAVQSYQSYGQQPLEMVAMSALSNMCVACQGLANIARDGQLISPISLSFIVAAESGERKTSADRKFSHAARDWQKERQEEMKDKVKAATAAIKAHEAQRNGLLAQITAFTKKGQLQRVEETKEQLEALELTAPTMPIVPRLFYEDTTQEALIEALSKGWPSASLSSDEAAIVLGGHGFREEKAMQFFGCLNRLWDGNGYSRNRSTTSSFDLYGKRLSCYLMMQETVLTQLLKVNDGQSRGTGFLARMLFAAPQSTMGTRLYKEPPAQDHDVEAFNTRMRQLLDMPLPVKEGTMELEPVVLTLSTESYGMWVAYYNEIEQQLGKLGDYEMVKDFAAKSGENVARLAGNFHVFTHGPQGTIEADTMQHAIEIVRWHLNETRRIFTRIDRPDETVLAETLWEWIAAKQFTSITLKQVSQYGPTRLRDKTKRDVALRKLVEHGYLIEQRDGARPGYQVARLRENPAPNPDFNAQNG